MNDVAAVLSDCDTAINLNNKYVKALDRRAKTLRKQAMKVENFEYQAELQRRFFEDFGGGPLILEPWFCSYFRGKRQAILHGVG